MNKKSYLTRIIEEFEEWWINFKHNEDMDFYKSTITKEHLLSLNRDDFIAFFYKFVSDGGRVQSGGERSKNKFKLTIEEDFDKFKLFVLKPFEFNFKLKDWFNQINSFSNFGVGIATIYLNRVNYYKYPIMNNKTVNALNKFGCNLSISKNYSNYMLVKKFQDKLIADYPSLANYHKADRLNHFIVAVYQGKELISDYLQIESFEDGLEQNEIEYKSKLDSVNLSKEALLERIKKCEKDKSEVISINGRSYKRHNYLMVQIKKYREYRCQFCTTTILKENGEYYIEACHINPKSKGGKDSLNNILILCPNCHKLFDYGKRDDGKIINVY